MTDHRKPCAHCGGNNITIHLNTVYCENCGVECESLTHWNNRPIEDAFKAKIEELEVAMMTIRGMVPQRYVAHSGELGQVVRSVCNVADGAMEQSDD